MGRTFQEIYEKIFDIRLTLQNQAHALGVLAGEVKDLIEDERETAVEEYINSQEG